MFRRKPRQSGSLEEAVRSALGNPDWLQGLRVRDGGEVTLIVAGDRMWLGWTAATRAELGV